MKTKSKDLGVELARIFGCLIVISCHTVPPIKIDGIPVFSRVFLSCLFGDGVAVFWLILGFFLFQNKNYINTIKKI